MSKPVLAFCLYKYFPYGGMQRNFMRIARECVQRGAHVRAYVLEWQGERPDFLELVTVPSRGKQNISRYRYYSEWVQAHLAANPVEKVVGFNKMPGLDVYYAADPCYAEKALTLRSWWYRFTPRYRHFINYEQAVFGPQAHTRVMLLSHPERQIFEKHYQLDARRVVMLPPGISRDFVPTADAAARRAALRAQHSLRDEDVLLVQVGSDFERKGVDRAITALASLPEALRRKSRLIVIGQAPAASMQRLAKRLDVDGLVEFIGGSDKVPDYLLAADLLLHAAYHENTGNVILEAMVSGLPTVVTEICGYSPYVRESEAGVVLDAPYRQEDFDQALSGAVGDKECRQRWAQNALRYSATADLYSRIECAADVVMEGL